MVDESEKVETADPPIAAYPPIKRVIKIEIPDENQQEVNSAGEENWTYQVQYSSTPVCSCTFCVYMKL